MADPKAKPKPREKSGLEPVGADAFAAAVGALVRLSRAKRGITRRQLAEQSGASERYLAQIESGQGNPSVIILKGIADALDVPVIELLPRNGGRSAALERILDLLAGAPPSELPAIADLIEGRTKPISPPTARNALHWSGCAAPASRRSGGCWRSASAFPSSSSTA